MESTMVRSFLLAAAFALLTGCATSKIDLAKQQAASETIPICTGDKDCNAKWEAAQLWVVHHAAYKIQTNTNVIIETYNSVGGNTGIAARVTKEPMGGGKYRILATIWCDNMFGCYPDKWDAVLDFNQNVRAATP